MITTDWINIAIGFGGCLFLWIFSTVLRKFKKPKYNWGVLKALVQDAEEHNQQSYKRLQELGNAFKEMEEDSK